MSEIASQTPPVAGKNSVSQVEMEVELMIKKLKMFLDRIEGHHKKTQRIQATIVKSKAFFSTQLKDVALVYDVSNIFKGHALS